MNDKTSYDKFPYPSKFFLQTFPDRLATAATLYGMQPPPIETCRVLELGCGNGSNLIAQAYGLPKAKFVGIDLSETHIDIAKRSAKEMGLSNLEFIQMDLMDLKPDDFGHFDYITAHGLFAWVPDFVRTKVLEIFAAMLTSNGVGYVSYNAYPGSYAREMVRSMLLYHTRGIDEPLAKVDKAMPLLEMLARNSTEPEVHARILQYEVKRHHKHDPADIYHDDLGAAYKPFYFHEFVSLLAGHGLQFLSEAELHASGIQGFADEAIGFLESINDPIEREQYFDFLRGRVFRQTLFCRDNIELERKPEPSMMDKFYLSSTLRPVDGIGDIAIPKVQKFRSARDQQLQIDHPLTKAALFHLGDIWGRSVSTPELLGQARSTLEGADAVIEDWEHQSEITRTILMRIALGSEMIELHIHQPNANTQVSDKPKVNRLARWQLRDANNILTLLNKDLKISDKTARRLAELLDGTRNRADIVRELRPFIKNADDIDEKERSELLKNLSGWVEQSINDLARIGLFES
jgi:SAM-dependent methyltransferase